ncbi:hypothetical protein, partial [Micromonospora sp. KC721]|uniref:hypothetical protein n=1 Tax=Micromonospora sp. KC721 TaxID=2530380 RepID=UPI001A9EBA93
PRDCAQATGGDYFIRQRTYPAAGSYPLVFGRGPIGPTLTADDPARPPAHRENNVMSVAVLMYADADSWHGGPTATSFADYPYATGSTTLTRTDGTVVGSIDRSGYGSFKVSAESTRYVLTTESTRTAPWSGQSSRQRIQWSFTSAHEPGQAALPLLAVRYDLALDSLNRAPAGTSFPLALSVEQSGSTTPPAIRLVTLAASADDGKSWRNLTVTRTGNRWTTTLPATIARGYVSLRATAVDLDGNRVEQTVIRAYALAP